MAYEAQGFDIGTLTAAGDYNDSTDQYVFVKQTSGTVFAVTAAITDVVLGILQDTPSSGKSGLIRIAGISKLRFSSTSHAAIAVGDKLGPSTETDGGADGSTKVGRYVAARAMEALAANTTAIITVRLVSEGGGSTGTQAAP